MSAKRRFDGEKAEPTHREILRGIGNIHRRLGRIDKAIMAIRITLKDGEQRHYPWLDLDDHKAQQVQRVFIHYKAHCEEEGYSLNRAINEAFAADELGFTCRASLRSWCYRHHVDACV